MSAARAARHGAAPPRAKRAKRPPAWLDRARTIGDPAADVLVARIVRSGRLAEVDRALAGVTLGDDALTSELPSSVRAFLTREGSPPWADRARLGRAQRFAERHSVALACALFCAALPMAFTGAKGTSVLYATRRLHDEMDDRVNETGRFVFDVLMPGGFESGRAVRSTQKVRLLHAAVRHRVLAARRASAGGDREIPINQEDLLGTLVCFSVVVLDTFEKMGIRVRADEAEDYMHLWRVVGALLGIREAWLPRDVAEARALGDAIRARQGGSTAEGRELSAVLVSGVERHLPAGGLGVVAPGLMRYFLGDETANLLALPEGIRGSDLGRWLPRAARWLGGWQSRAFEGALPKLGRSVLELVMDKKLGGRAPSFHAPLSSATCPLHHDTPKARRTPRP